MLTGVVTAATYYVVNRQLETVTVNRSFTQAEDADEHRSVEQHGLNPQVNPQDTRSGADEDYVSAGYDSGSDTLMLTMRQGDEQSRNLILAVSIVPIIVFGLLSGGVTWIIATRAQRRINGVASQMVSANDGLERRPIVIPYEHDEASTIAAAYNRMLKDLNNAIVREKEFIANASHELKNPLAATAAALEVPLHNRLFDERCRPFVEKALASNSAGVEIVDHLLELSKVQQLDRADLGRVDVAGVIRTVLQDNEHLMADGVEMHVDLERVYILADRLLLRQMITNLILNAVQHNQDAHPQVWVRLSGDMRYEGEPCVMMEISNTGEDLSGANVDDLLVPFNRGDASRVTAHGGPASAHHGLGLSIVREIVMMHHGHLMMRPRQGGGLEVTVFLPAASSESQTESGPEPE
ncbi:sensor histidine kinase [Bifidobacterium rousetti]|uniref:sensor histidine kinase n=1 Tax=Bifidobacterium rousetti TaxID=2045439 RepID=UPI001CC2FD85|nr:HAMP domain-containing sensor histidine kinase [Bifidobacterium rousetti]